jgi:hypothetical protein
MGSPEEYRELLSGKLFVHASQFEDENISPTDVLDMPSRAVGMYVDAMLIPLLGISSNLVETSEPERDSARKVVHQEWEYIELAMFGLFARFDEVRDTLRQQTPKESRISFINRRRRRAFAQSATLQLLQASQVPFTEGELTRIASEMVTIEDEDYGDKSTSS